MPDELTPVEVSDLAKRLRVMRDKLRQGLDVSAESTKPVELDQQSVGRLSRMDAIQQQAMAKAARRNTETRLKQCIAALGLVDRGQYGECRRCEEPIGFARLDANPESLMCLDCQATRD